MCQVEHLNPERNVVFFFFLGETSTIVGCFCGFVVPGAPEGSTGEVDFCCCFWRSPGLNLRPLVYKAID